MQKQGSIVLGIVRDNGGYGGGQWFEGAVVSGATPLKMLNAVQANIVSAGYAR